MMCELGRARSFFEGALIDYMKTCQYLVENCLMGKETKKVTLWSIKGITDRYEGKIEGVFFFCETVGDDQFEELTYLYDRAFEKLQELRKNYEFLVESVEL